MNLSAYETYCLYLAIKNHFTTTSYDYFKYSGKVPAKKDTFELRRDRFQFQRLSRKYPKDQMLDFLVANFTQGKQWVGDLLEDEAHQNYLKYLKRKQAFTYTFTGEVEKIFGSVNNPQEIFKAKDSYPPLIEMILSGDVGQDTFSVLNAFFNFMPKFDREIGTNDIIWKNIRLVTLKFLPFIEYDSKRIKAVIKTTLNI